MLKLDKIDLRILSALQRDGRMTKLRLAEAVHLSPAACWVRLRRLEESGVIAGYGARIDMERIGRRTTVLVEVTLKSHQQVDFHRFEAAIARENAIVACYATGGGIDYILKVIVPDIDTYQRTMDRLLTRDIGINRYFTYVVTKTVKEGQGPDNLEQIFAPDDR
jgi:Lrp/AsnC family transcriptional regulator, regulator of ectoine-degradation genes